MTGRERVLAAISHLEPDRVPLDVWMDREDVQQEVIRKWGDLDAFYDDLDVDMFTAAPAIPAPETSFGLELDEALEAPYPDPDDSQVLQPVVDAVRHHGEGKGRAISAWVPGVFEMSCTLIGIEKALMALALEPEKMLRLMAKIAEWTVEYSSNCIDAGADMILVADDWGQNQKLLISPRDWWRFVFPNEKKIADAVRQRGAALCVHSDGFIEEVLDGALELGVQILHPVQESAGMDQVSVKERYGEKLTIYGGLDIRSVLPRATDDRIVSVVKTKMAELKHGGGFIFCTSHTVQPDTDLAKVELAYRVAQREGTYGT